MTVQKLLEQLIKCDRNAEVHCGYDGDIVCVRASSVEAIEVDSQIGPCWHHVKIGDVVILSEE